jgi:hypothetical protein
MNTKSYRRPLAVATTVLVGGIAASLAGNLQAINLKDAAPGIGSYVSAILWPLFLFGAIEVMLHTPWISGWRDGLTRWAGLLSVAGVAFWISYWHMAHVLAAYGYDAVSAHAGPLAVDLTMAMATLALNRVGQARTVDLEPVPAAVLPAGDIEPTNSWLERMDILASEMDTDTTPAYPLEINPVSGPPALARSNEVKAESIPEDVALMIKTWGHADKDSRPAAGVMAELLAADSGRSPRTIRRWRTALGVN